MRNIKYQCTQWILRNFSSNIIRTLIKNKKSIGNAMHIKLMRTFRLYILVGGMPQAVETYLEYKKLIVLV